jgi:hypothetical protein
MNTSPTTPFLSEILNGETIPLGKLAYFRQRLLNRFYDLILGEFLKQEQSGLTKAEVARRIGRRPEQVTRWLGAPGNWTLETVSDLSLAISKAEPEASLITLKNLSSRNFQQPDWLKEDASSAKKRFQQSLDAFLEEMKKNPYVESRVVMLVNWIADQLVDIARLNDLGGGNDKIMALANEMKAHAPALGAAVVANTPYANQKPLGSTPSG